VSADPDCHQDTYHWSNRNKNCRRYYPSEEAIEGSGTTSLEVTDSKINNKIGNKENCDVGELAAKSGSCNG
jgi:hypothetical protein